MIFLSKGVKIINMKQENFNSLNEILNVINQEKKDIEILQEDLKVKSRGRLRRFLSSDTYEKEKFKLYRSEMEGKIEEKRELINKLEDYLDRLCIFNFDVATDFITRVLSIIEGEEYQKINLELSYSYLDPSLSINTDIPTYTTDYEDVCLISTIKNIKLISDMYDNGDLVESYDIDRAIRDNKYILLETNDTYKMFNYSIQQVPEKLSRKYYYLADIIIDLINLRLINPNLTDVQVTSIMLEQISERYSNLIKSEQIKRR